MSDRSPGALRNGPESAHVVAATGYLLDGATWEAREALRAGAEDASWSSVAHRLDVAGRSLCADRLLDRSADEVLDDHDETGLRTDESRSLLQAWLAGGGMEAAVDLIEDAVDTRTDEDRCWLALAVLAWLVDTSGFPPEVVV